MKLNKNFFKVKKLNAFICTLKIMVYFDFIAVFFLGAGHAVFVRSCDGDRG